MFTGLLFVFPHLFQAALTVSLIIAIHLQVKIEERVLAAATLGKPDLACCRCVGRWIGTRLLQP